MQDLRLHTGRLKVDLNEAEEATFKTKEERERLQFRFNELTVTNQMTQRIADDARNEVEILRAEDIARAEEIAKMRSDGAPVNPNFVHPVILT
jgi:hypothetical protein